MTTKEAIAYWEVFQCEIDLLYPLCDERSKATLGEQREPVALALSALRAQQKLESNQPLTMDDLRHMNGEVVFCEKLGVYVRFKGVVRVANHYRNGVFIVGVPIWFSNTDNYGKTWLAYRHKPKEA